jgi:hypothetical protein
MKRLRAAFLFLLCLISASLLTAPASDAEVTEEDFFPIYFGRTREEPEETILDEDFNWPFGAFHEDRELWWGAVRPLASWGEHQEKGNFFRFLPPIGLFNWKADEFDYRIQPFWYHRWKALPDGHEDWEYRLFPLYATDSNRDQDPSTAYFLFYGHLYDRFGVDEAEYYLFPLYLRTRRGEFVNHTLLWPFLGYGSGGGGSNLRLWPIFGHKVVPGKKNAIFVAWPFWGSAISLDEDGEQVETCGCFPLYVSVDSPRRKGWTFLWPFFRHNQVNRPRRTWDDFAAPFPFYQRTTETLRDNQGGTIGGQDTRLYFPFYGHIQKESRSRRLDAEYWTPFLWRIDRMRTDRFSASQWIFFPFVWDKLTRWASTPEVSHDFKLWPLLSYEQPEKGGEFLRIIDPFWFRRGGDLDRHYSVFYSLYEHERDAEGFGYDQLLGKAVYHARYRDYARTNILHLVQFFDTPADGRGWSLARGLLSWSRVEQGEESGARWKVLWIPFGTD